MSATSRPITLAAAAILVAALLPGPALAGHRGGRSRGEAAPAPQPPESAPVADIRLSYKRDPRVVDPYRGLGPWVAGPGYTGATAQESVEAQARPVDARGQVLDATAEWVASDPGMVAVTPARGDRVTIGVRRAGESRLIVKAGGLSKELTLRARMDGKFMVFEIAGPAPAKAPEPPLGPGLEGRSEQVSYAVGMNLAGTLRKQSVEVDPDLVRQGFKDALSGGRTRMTEEQARLALTGVETQINITEAGLQAKLRAQRNRRAGEEFLAANGKKEGIVSLPSGLQYKVLQEGQGKTPTLEDVAVCHYRGQLLDGTEFDNSRTRKTREPVPFPVSGVIAGWREALQLMPAGSRWQLFVPPELAYGERGAPRSRIGPDSTLIFEVELLAVEPPGARRPVARAQARTELTSEEAETLKQTLQVLQPRAAEKARKP